MTPSPGASLNTGPTQIVLAFSEPLAQLTALQLANYSLLGSQGDGEFVNDTVDIPINNIAYDDAQRLVTLTVNGGTPLPNDTYQLRLAGAGGIADAAGNPLDGEWPSSSGGFPSGNGVAGGDFLAVFTVGPRETVELSPTQRRWSFADQDGDTVMVSFGGSAGKATLTRAEPQGQPGDIQTITFAGTDHRSSLTITVKETETWDWEMWGDGTTIRSVSGDGVGTLNMKNVDLVGNTINLDGALKKLVVDDILDGSNIILGGAATDQLTITAHEVGDVDLTFPGILKSATVTKWTGGTIDVRQVGALTVRYGALGAAIRAAVVSKVSVTHGDLTGNIQATERIGAVSVKWGSLTGNIQATERIGAVSVKWGSLTGNIEASGRIDAVSVKWGSLTGDLYAGNHSGDRRRAALGSVKVEGGDITGRVTVENGGNAGSILVKAAYGLGGAIGDDANDAITVAGRLTSVTSYGALRAAITVQNASGSAKGNALNLVKAIGGSLFGAVEVLNGGNLGTLQARRIEANVNVAGKATLVRTELDRVVAPEPAPPFVAVTAGGKATVKGASKTKVDLPTGGGTAYVVAV